MTFRYDPVGECIYCGTTEKPLGREHIIPLALNGDRILPEASCNDCADATKRIEGYVARNMFGAFRAAHNMRTRRPKDRPTSYPITGEAEGNSFSVDVPVADYPLVIMLPQLPPARFLRGLPDAETIEGNWWVWHQKDKLDAVAIKAGFEEATVSPGECSPTKWSQMLAKIGHSAAIAHFGLGPFQPMAIDLALGRVDSINYLVGCWEEPPPDTTELHTVGFRFHNTNGTIVADIRLFANLGAPSYHVVVGVKND